MGGNVPKSGTLPPIRADFEGNVRVFWTFPPLRPQECRIGKPKMFIFASNAKQSTVMNQANDKMDLVKVAEFNDPLTAHIVAQMLIANGIDATVVGDVSPYPALNVIDLVKVMVLEKDLEDAKALIASDQSGNDAES